MSAASAVVPYEVSAAKLRANLDDVRRMGAGRGRWMVVRESGLEVDVILLTRPAGSNWTIAPTMIRLDYRDYDLAAPSLQFLDPVTSELAMPLVMPIEVANGAPRQLIPGPHPLTGLPFLCIPNVGEYHSHPQHDDGSWLAYWRDLAAGRVETICDELWKAMCQQVAIQTQLQLVPIVQLPVPVGADPPVIDLTAEPS